MFFIIFQKSKLQSKEYDVNFRLTLDLWKDIEKHMCYNTLRYTLTLYLEEQGWNTAAEYTRGVGHSIYNDND